MVVPSYTVNLCLGQLCLNIRKIVLSGFGCLLRRNKQNNNNGNQCYGQKYASLQPLKRMMHYSLKSPSFFQLFLILLIMIPADQST